jgi:hypothetical protein
MLLHFVVVTMSSISLIFLVTPAWSFISNHVISPVQISSSFIVVSSSRITHTNDSPASSDYSYSYSYSH